MHASAAGHVLEHSHEPLLAALSVLVALVGSYAALDLLGQLALAEGRARALWLFAASLALGVAIWAMHFVAMLAYRLPVPVGWDLGAVAVALAVSVAGSGAGLALVTRRLPLGATALPAGAVFVGFAIVGMHFTGMSAVRVAAVQGYAPVPLALAAAVAAALSGAALWVALRAGGGGPLSGEVVRRGGGAVLLAGGIAGMHYLAMSGTHFTATGGDPAAAAAAGIRGTGALAWSAGAGALCVSALAIVGSLYGQRLDASLAQLRALGDSERRFRSLFRHVPDVTAILDADGAVRHASPSVKRLLGYGPEELAGMDAFGLVHPEDRGRARRLLEEPLPNPDPTTRPTLQLRFRRKDGSWCHTEAMSSNLLTDEDVRGLVVALRDVTEREEAERRLRESEERHRLLVEQVPAVTYATHLDAPDSTPSYVSPQVERMLGYSPERWLTEPGFWAEHLHPDDREEAVGKARAALEGEGSVTPVEYRMVAKDGREVWVRDEASVVEEADGSRLLRGVMVDVTERRRAEDRLRLLESVAVNANDAVLITEAWPFGEPGPRIVYANRAFCRMTGYTSEEVVGRTPRLLQGDGTSRGRLDEIRASLEGWGPVRAELMNYRKDGSPFWVELNISPVADESGRITHWVSVQRETTGRRRAQEALEESERRFRSVVQNSSEAVKITNTDGTLRYASPAVGRLFGYDPEELVGENMLDYVHPEDLPVVREKSEKALEDPETNWNVAEYRFRHKDGSYRHVESAITYLLDDPAVGGVVANVRDVTERKALEERLVRQALRDPLTGLPNRRLLSDRLGQALARSAREGGTVAVLFVDLDDFKVVNDSLGHEAGDRLLAAVAARLDGCLRPGDTAARLGGDEFAVVLEGAGRAEAVAVAGRIAGALRDPVDVGEREVYTSTSVGIALSEELVERTQDQAGELMRAADLAMYRAKGGGKARYEVFEAGMGRAAEERLELEEDLRRALNDPEGGQIVVRYQPKVSLRSGRTFGMEALARWEHPERGMLPPGRFVPLAEETGLIFPLGRRVLSEACRQARRWRQVDRPGGAARDHVPPPVVCINVSPRQLERPGLVRDVKASLEEAGLPPEALRLEITEGSFVNLPPGFPGGAATSLAVLDDLRAFGIKLSVDDFGTGYSSLSYLKRLPVDAVKVDQSFVAGLGRDRGDEEIVAAVISVARALGLEAVAEGVETEEQVGRLREMGCDLAQGNLFSVPLSAEDALRLVAEAPRWLRSAPQKAGEREGEEADVGPSQPHDPRPYPAPRPRL